MRAALDTNLLVYAEGFGDEQRVSATRALLEQLSDADLVVPLQCLGELFRVLTGKASRSAVQAQDAVLGWMDAFPVLETNAAAWRGAMDLCVVHQLAAGMPLCSMWRPRVVPGCCSRKIFTPASAGGVFVL